jgi:UDP-N-acetylglucosamine diphosphorylase/glucosamine-1-phosphate N-acetyltransferase
MEKQVNAILFDDTNRNNLLPLTFTRPVAELRIGITTIKEKWESAINRKCSFATAGYLSGKYPMVLMEDNLFINAGVIPGEDVVRHIVQLKSNELLKQHDLLIAYRSSKQINLSETGWEYEFNGSNFTGELVRIENTWDIFELNDRVLRNDFGQITRGRESMKLSPTNKIMGDENIFMEEGAMCECAIINATTGPVYIGRNAEIMEGSVLRGPLALCENALIKMGAKIYGATTIGPYCKVGGEVHNSVFTGFSSKPHDGYLGNAVLGEWCNLGADTNNSNLKNNYDIVKLWSYTTEHFIDTGLQFCGLIMGDHSKCGINTMFNTGTVVGVSANIYGSGFPRNFIPSFSWGGPGGFTLYKPEKAFETAKIAMARRGMVLTDEDKSILLKVFELTEKYRKRGS